MKKSFYYVELPVFGELGPKTCQDSTSHPPEIHELHCSLDMVPMSEISTIFPVVILTCSLGKALLDAKCSGFTLRPALFEPSEQFREVSRGKLIPPMEWCLVVGEPYKDDFGFANVTKLIVSDRAKKIIESVKHQGVTFVAGERPPTEEEIDAQIWANAAKVAADLTAKRKTGR